MSRQRLLLLGAALVLTAAVFGLVLPRIASYGSVWGVVSSLSTVWLCALLVVTLLNVLTFPLPWLVVLPALGLLRGLQMTQASTAFTMVVPGGATLGMGASFAMLRSWGYAAADVTRAVALTGIWNQLSTFLFPVVAVVALAAYGEGGTTIDVVAVAASTVFLAAAGAVAVLLASRAGSERIVHAAFAVLNLGRRVVRRPPSVLSTEAIEEFRSETTHDVRAHWPMLTIATLLNQATAFALLALSLRAVGVPSSKVDLAESFAAWTLARLLASLPLTPGGLGFIELGLTGMLVGFGGPNAKVVASVLIFRVLSLVPTTALGLVAFLTWNRFAPPAEPAGTG